MKLDLTRESLPRVLWLDEVGSTNAALRELVETGGDEVPHGTLVATANQTAGRGRQGREWETPPDTALAASVLVRAHGLASMSDPAQAERGAERLGASWLPLLAGSAVAAALQPLFRAGENLGEGEHRGEDLPAPKRVGVKWPNDVHVRDESDAMEGRVGAKLSGILSELLPGGEIVVGFGVNLLQEDWQLPTERAGSVLVCGGAVGGAVTLADPRGEHLADLVLARAVTELLRLVELAVNDPVAARRRVLRDSFTIGSEVRVHLPDGQMIDGRAVGLDESGALLVDRPTTGQLVVNAADVEHLR